MAAVWICFIYRLIWTFDPLAPIGYMLYNIMQNSWPSSLAFMPVVASWIQGGLTQGRIQFFGAREISILLTITIGNWKSQHGLFLCRSWNVFKSYSVSSSYWLLLIHALAMMPPRCPLFLCQLSSEVGLVSFPTWEKISDGRWSEFFFTAGYNTIGARGCCLLQ